MREMENELWSEYLALTVCEYELLSTQLQVSLHLESCRRFDISRIPLHTSKLATTELRLDNGTTVLSPTSSWQKIKGKLLSCLGRSEV